jgi:hypothetical protein
MRLQNKFIESSATECFETKYILNLSLTSPNQGGICIFCHASPRQANISTICLLDPRKTNIESVVFFPFSSKLYVNPDAVSRSLPKRKLTLMRRVGLH